MLSLNRFPNFLLLSIFFVVMGTSSNGNEDGASLRLLTQDERNIAKEAGYSYVDRLAQVEEDMYAQGFHVKEGSSMSTMAKFKRPSQDVIDLSRTNLRFVETVRYLKNDLGLKEEEIERVLRDGEFDSGCLPDPICTSPQKYRTIDGSCNHRDIKLRNLGRSVSGYRRLLKPAYDDGVSSPRSRSKSGIELPSPRLISMKVFIGTGNVKYGQRVPIDGFSPLNNVTSLLMLFGQFVNHDMESTSQFTFPNGEGFSCCALNNLPLDPSVLNSLVHCLPIKMAKGDPQLEHKKEGCMNFVRSSTGPNRISCKLPFVSYAEQFNQNTHWLDASTVYGSSFNTTTISLNVSSGYGSGFTSTTVSLRNTSNGLLNIGRILGKNSSYLPKNPSLCLDGCYFAGDSRVMEHLTLVTIHTIWMREHNRIATILSNLNPAWSSETVFQEARRIVIAELQHITYSEFLPTLLGFSGMQKYSLLRPLPGSKTLKNNKEPTSSSGPISNEFATAAFRMGHSLVQDQIYSWNQDNEINHFPLRYMFHMPTRLGTDNMIRGLVKVRSQKIDNQIVDALRLHLFQNEESKRGRGIPDRPAIGTILLDLVALNIQRGRDHGLQSYNSYREHCGLPKLTSPISGLPTTKPNDTISPYFDQLAVKALESVYQNVDDIDLYVGGLLEINQQEDALLGPTFMCIIAENFLTLKFEDRYFYEAGEGTNPYPFTSEQLIEIKKSSMSRIFCDNDEGSLSTIQPNAFLIPSEKNPIEDCKSGSIPRLNLNLWKVGGPNKP